MLSATLRPIFGRQTSLEYTHRHLITYSPDMHDVFPDTNSFPHCICLTATKLSARSLEETSTQMKGFCWRKVEDLVTKRKQHAASNQCQERLASDEVSLVEPATQGQVGWGVQEEVDQGRSGRLSTFLKDSSLSKMVEMNMMLGSPCILQNSTLLL